MFLAAVGFAIMLIGSIGLPAPAEISGVSDKLVSPSWLINTYFVLTVAELFLSPMGLSFVSKVAPPQYSGLMQGGWLAATAIGNLLVGVIGTFWEKLLGRFLEHPYHMLRNLRYFHLSVMKRLEKQRETHKQSNTKENTTRVPESILRHSRLFFLNLPLVKILFPNLFV